MAHAPNHYAQAVQDTIERVLRQPSLRHSTTSLGAAADIPSLQLDWLFQGMVGETIEQFVCRICLERAVAQLVRTEQPFADIASDLGFPSLPAFEAAFKAAFTSSPRFFRRLRTPRFELPAACDIHYVEGKDPALFLPVDTGGRHIEVITRFQPSLALALTDPLASRLDVDASLAGLRATLGETGLVSPSPSAARGFLVHQLGPDGRRSLAAAVEITHADALPPGGHTVTLPAGRVASTMVTPSMPVLATWLQLFGEWLPSSRERLREGPLLERLIDEGRPARKPGPRTELLLPIA